MDETEHLFSISAAAQLAGMHPQTLRQYDRIGLVQPQRTAGRSRRYSLRDIVQLREVQRLSNAGVSLEGIRRMIDLENQVHRLQSRVAELEAALDDALIYRPGARTFAAGIAGEIVTLDQGRRRVQATGGELVVWRPVRQNGRKSAARSLTAHPHPRSASNDHSRSVSMRAMVSPTASDTIVASACTP